MANNEVDANAQSARFVEMVVRTLRHEVGDLLQSVYSAVAILQERLPSSLTTERTVLAELRNRAEMCKNELDATHDLVCPVSLNASWLDLSELATGITTAYGPRYPGLQLACDAPRPVKIWGDGQRIKQVGLVLITSLSQAARSKILQRVGPATNGHDAEWSFQHDGQAPDAEQLSWISTPFHTTRHARFGLGLALARRVVELHGGRVTTEALQQGFKITLFLPLHPPQGRD